MRSGMVGSMLTSLSMQELRRVRSGAMDENAGMVVRFLLANLNFSLFS